MTLAWLGKTLWTSWNVILVYKLRGQAYDGTWLVQYEEQQL